MKLQPIHRSSLARPVGLATLAAAVAVCSPQKPSMAVAVGCQKHGCPECCRLKELPSTAAVGRGHGCCECI